MIKIKLILLISILALQAAYSQSDQSIKNLTAFSKAYGYVKYFHPSDEAYQLDWDLFAIYGSKEVQNCQNDKELVFTLNKIFSPIAPSSKFVLKQDKSAYALQTISPEKTKNYKQIYWQHNGLSLGMFGNGRRELPYKSIRVNKTDNIDHSARSGNVRTSIDPKDIRGKEFKYEGWAKLKAGSVGKGYLWVLVERLNNEITFFDKTLNTPVVKDKWERFEIKGKIDSLAANLSFGCYLDGKGSLLFDHVGLLVKENGEWVNVPVKNGDFEEERISSEWKKKTSWYGQGVGYEIDLEDKEKYSGEKSVRIHHVGNLKVVEGKPLFHTKPNMGTIIDKEIVKNVCCQIPLVLYGNKKGTYPVSNRTNLSRLKKRVSGQSANPNELFARLGNVIITYNIFQHFYPYFDVIPVDWDAAFQSAIKQSYLDKNRNDHLETLERFTAKLKDGHISVRGGDHKNYIPPILWEWVENRLVITYVMDKDSNLKRGAIIEKINGVSPHDYFQATEERISAATDGWLNYVAQRKSLYGLKGSTIALQIDSTMYELTRDFTYQRVVESNDISPVKYKFYRDSSIVYLNFDLIEMDAINSLMSNLEDSKAIICDFRGHPRGTSNFLSHLVQKNENDPTCFQIPQIVYPDLENICGYQMEEWAIDFKKPYLGGKQVIFITDGRAISTAESYLSFIKGFKLGTIIGQPTAGTNGNVNRFRLPGEYHINWTGMKVLKRDGSQHHAIGVLPDVRIEKTINGIIEGRDEFLDKALELIK